jgi:hypothetical protein
MGEFFNILSSAIISWEPNGKQVFPEIKNIVNFPMNNEYPKLECYLTEKKNFKLKNNKYNLEYSSIAFPLTKNDFNHLEKTWTSEISFNINKNDWFIIGILFDNTIFFLADNEKKGFVIGNLRDRYYGKSVVSIVSFYRDIFM